MVTNATLRESEQSLWSTVIINLSQTKLLFIMMDLDQSFKW